jgi:hypothetical protein
MLIALLFLLLYLGGRTLGSLLQALRALPRSNEDWIYY